MVSTLSLIKMTRSTVKIGDLRCKAYVDALFDLIEESGPKATEGKLRGFAFTCCRRVFDLLTDARSKESLFCLVGGVSY
jgi:hypothetical protein